MLKNLKPTRQTQTGSDDPDKIGGTSLYYGNSSLLAALESDSSLEVYGTDGTQDTPRMWEGFGEYRLVYLLRKAGLDYRGNDTVVGAITKNRRFTHTVQV